MKKTLCYAMFMLMMLCLSLGSQTINPIFDEDIETAPLINLPFDASNLKHKTVGYQVFLENPLAVNGPYPPDEAWKYTLPFLSIFDKDRQLVYYSTGSPNSNGFRYWVNSTDDYQMLVFPGGALCFKVAPYNYTNNINEYKWLSRSGSSRLTTYAKKVGLRDQIDDLFGKSNRNCQEKPDDDIMDHYYGIVNEGSTCGGDCGLQKQASNIIMYVSRYADLCYGKKLVVREEIVQFFPLGTSRNLVNELYVLTDFLPVGDISSYQNEINTYCQNAPNYSVFYNSQCPFPTQPNVACGTLSTTGRNLHSNLNIDKLYDHFPKDQVDLFRQHYKF